MPEATREDDGSARAAEDLVAKGRELSSDGRHDDEIATYDALVGRYGDSEDPSVRERVAKALYLKAITLAQLNRDAEAIVACEDLYARFGGSDEPGDLTAIVAKGLGKHARILAAAGRPDEALGMWTRVSERTVSERAPGGSVLGAISRAGQAKQLHNLGRNEDAISVCDELVDRFGADTRPVVREAMCEALFVKILAAAAQDRPELATAAVDDLISRFGDAPEPTAWNEITGALLLKLLLSLGEGRSDVALDCCRRVCEQIKGAPDRQLLAVYGAQLLTAASTFRAAAQSGHRQGSPDRPPGPLRSWQLLLAYLKAVQNLPRARARPLLVAALSIDEGLIAALQHTNDPRFEGLVVEAQLDAITSLCLLGRFRDASRLVTELVDGGKPVIDALQIISDRTAAQDRTSARIRAANLLAIRVWALQTLGDTAATQAAVAEMTRRFGDDGSLRVRGRVWMARHVIARPPRSLLSSVKRTGH